MLVCYPAHSGPGLEEVQLLVVDGEAEHAAAEARGVAEVPQPERSLAHVRGQPAQVERPRHAEPVPGSVIQNTPSGVMLYLYLHCDKNITYLDTPPSTRMVRLRPASSSCTACGLSSLSSS